LDRETFGADFLAVGAGSVPVAKLFENSPLPSHVRADIERVEEGTTDYFPQLTSAQKKLVLSKMSYRDFLVQVIKVDPLAATYYQSRTSGFWGVGFDAINALDCWALGFPGFKGLQLEPGSIPHMGYSARGIADTGGSKRLHFPDGNASIARLLVRKLVPEAVPGQSADDIVTSKVLYNRLDVPGSEVRLRLSSTAVRVQNIGSNSYPSAVEVTYVRDGAAYTVRGKQCVLACYNMMIPFLCPEMPDKQKTALHSLVKAPLVYTSVAIRNWEAFAKLKVAHISAPCSYHTSLALNASVNVGAYRSSTSPKEPILVHMTRVPCRLGLPEHEQNKAGRAELLSTPFATFERNIRDQLNRILGRAGFDPSADIEAITVNRWPHGYAPEYNPLWDPDLPPNEQPNIVGRARFGNITIANSDSGKAAYTDSAIDQADRAVNELLHS
jgi:spermidine dehydrogenase